MSNQHEDKLLGFDATFAIGNYRGMGRYVRQLISAYNGPSIGFSPKHNIFLDNPWPLISEGNLLEPLWEQFYLPKLLKKNKVDLLLCGFNTSPIVRSCPPTILVLHDLIFQKPLLSLKQFQSRRQVAGAIYRRIVAPMAVKKAAEIVTVSETSRLEICAAFNLPLERVLVIPNTLPEFWFQDNLISSPEQSAGSPYILAVSGSAPSKNLFRLIQAFSNAQQSSKVKELNLLVVGLGQQEHDQFKRVADEFGVGNKVVLCPRVSDQELKSLYSKAVLFVFPSTHEGFGIPLLEAMAVRVPVICSSIPVFHEIGLDYVGYFDPFSIDDLAKSLISALSRETNDVALNLALEHAKTYSFVTKQAQITELFKKIILKHVP